MEGAQRPRPARRRAIDHAYTQLTEPDGEHEAELSGVQRKLTETRAAMDRYFRAFEAGAMPEDTCAPRIAAFSEQAKALEARASELASLSDSEPAERISAAYLDAIRRKVRAALDDGGPMRVKTILQELTEEVRIDARDAIEPTFSIPAVPPPSGSMALAGLLSNPVGPLKALLEGPHWIRQESVNPLRKRSGQPRQAARAIGARHRRAGWIVEAIVRVLAGQQEPMQAKEVHAAVETLLKEPVRWASVKAALAANVTGPSPLFVRVARGRYRLR